MNTIMTALLTITTVFYIGLAAAAARRKTPAARFFALLIGLAAVWTATVIGEISAVELSTKIAFMQARLMFICFIPFAWLGLVLSLTGKFSTFVKPFLVLLLIVPTATAILALTTRFHNHFRYDFAVETIRGLDLLVFKRSRWDVLHEIDNHVISLLGFFILIGAWHSSSGLLHKQTAILGISFIVPLTANLLFVFGVLPPIGINPTPIVLIPASILQAWVVLNTRILDIIPIARSMVLDQIDIGTVVLDSNHRIADINRAALGLIGVQEKEVFGRAVNTLPPPWETLDPSLNMPLEPVQIGSDRDPRWIRIEKAPVAMGPKPSRGILLLLKDVTDEVLRHIENEEKRVYEQQWKQQQLQKLLLRDIHDGLGGLTSNLLYMAVLAQKESSPDRKNDWLRKIETTAMETNTEIRGLMNALETTSMSWGELIESVRRTAEVLFNRDSSRIEFHIQDVPHESEVGITEGLSVSRMIRECMNNIVKHAHATEVQIRINITDEHINILISDNGIGFDPRTARRGRGLNHLEKRAAELGGEFTVTTINKTHQAIHLPRPLQISTQTQPGAAL
jgi:signal transduction histidine kinase